MQTFKDTWTVFGAELRRALKSPRVLLVLLLYVAFSAGVMLAAGALAHQAQLQAEAQGQGTGGLESPKAALLALLFGQDRALVESLLELPAVLLVVFKLGLVFLPAYVAVLGFDTVSAELQTRSLRYLSVRTSRMALALGKALALAAVVLLLVTLVHLGAFAYALSNVPDFSLAEAAHAWPRLWGTTALVGVGMAALTTLCSAASRAPALSLTLNFALLLGFWAAGAVGSGARMMRMVQQQMTEQEHAVNWQERIGLLAPSTWSAEVLYPDVRRALTGALVLFLFSLFCAAGAVGVLRTRDV
jgi:ABC-type transport system involved in multi-copper enzyme maturation permease subunit